jgi:broad specificity phosphatase PhoE
MAGSKEVLLVRHGETDDNAADRFQGQLDTPLNDRGREQARAVARIVAGEGLRALYSSPLVRASETAEIVGAVLNLDPVLDERLMEADAGDWSGRLYAEIIADQSSAFDAWRAADPAFRFPNGESVAEQTARVAAALTDVRAGPLPALVVCHGGVNRAVEGLRVTIGAVGNCSLYRLAVPSASTP